MFKFFIFFHYFPFNEEHPEENLRLAERGIKQANAIVCVDIMQI